ncbi:MAG: oligosaccharide flippase family protein [Hyphomicrobiaceae bacterium]
MPAAFQLSSLLSACASRLAGDRLVRNLGWYGAAELTARLSRLLATVILARHLGATELGIAAIAITCFELIRVLTNNGIGQFVVRAASDRLDATCNAAYRASWFVCGTAFVFQIVAGALIAHVCGRSDLFAMIVCLAGVYVLMVPGLLPVYLLMRNGRIKAIAGVGVAQVAIDNLLTAAFAIAGFGAWAIVLPKLLTAPIWLIGVRRCQTWHQKPAAGYVDSHELIRFTVPILGSEILAAARVNLDKLVVWGMLGVDALGIYYFAFNAGIGFSLALTSALSTSLYPELAKLAGAPKEMRDRYDSAIRKTALPIAGVIVAQAAVCFVYVPLVFGPRWQDAVTLVALLCLSAATKPFFDSGAQLLRAADRPAAELAAALLLTFLTLAALAIGLTRDLTTGVALFAMASMALQALLAFWARDFVNPRDIDPTPQTPRSHVTQSMGA